jgi:cellobiose-specific phosphotransferase system component IIC
MNGLMAWMEKYILPTAAKIGAQKHLVALRDAFIGTLQYCKNTFVCFQTCRIS